MRLVDRLRRRRRFLFPYRDLVRVEIGGLEPGSKIVLREGDATYVVVDVDPGKAFVVARPLDVRDLLVYLVREEPETAVFLLAFGIFSGVLLYAVLDLLIA